MPIELSNDMLARGCDSGCAPSTSCAGRQASSFQSLPCIRCWALSNLLLGQAAFRGRNRETFSESRMREMRLSGSMSENRKQSHANRIEARSAKAALTNATGRLPLLRLFSTPLINHQQRLIRRT